MVRGYFTTGKNIRVRCQVKRGFWRNTAGGCGNHAEGEKQAGSSFFFRPSTGPSARRTPNGRSACCIPKPAYRGGRVRIPGIKEYKPDIATIEDVERTHFCFPNTKSILTESHLVSAGGAIKAAKLVMEKREDRAFALVRPPGHHAMKVVHGSRGFCNINIEAVMVEHIREQYGRKRVAIVDTDCHHGDGTQDIYWHDPDTLYISVHQDGRTLYPGSGFTDEQGGPNAIGRTVNIPLPPETSDEGFLYVLEKVILPILDEFKPDLIINSAGQDNHYSDPITNMRFSAQGYARLNELLKPDIAVLEGGYSIQGALPYVNPGSSSPWRGWIIRMCASPTSTGKRSDRRPT